MRDLFKNAIKELQDEVKNDDVEKIKEKTIKLTETAGKIAEQAYKKEAAKQADAQQKGDGANNAKQAKDNVVDADFKEVDDEEPKEKTTKTKTK